MAASCLPDRVSVSFVVALAAAMIACSPWNSARAFDFFGLWGSDESLPPVSRIAISYAVAFDLRPADGDELARRAQGAARLIAERGDD